VFALTALVLVSVVLVDSRAMTGSLSALRLGNGAVYTCKTNKERRQPLPTIGQQQSAALAVVLHWKPLGAPIN
jgi:hypothetical protein